MPRSLCTLSKPPGTVPCGPAVPHLLVSCLLLRLCDTQLLLALYPCRQPHTPDTRWVSEQVPPSASLPRFRQSLRGAAGYYQTAAFPTCAPCCAAPKTIRPFPRSRFRRCTLSSQALAVNPLVSS
ncbi:hypothetical protein C8R43DRAFT_976174 [Mycena crocata]|nr:hypothetical protein C8R43DRAFT_976174 [Mycena crocata]